MEKNESKKTGPVWVRVADGIYKNTTYKKPWLYERPIINSKKTFKGLGTTSIKLGREELIRHQAARQGGKEPTAKTTTADTVGAVIRLYAAAGYPNEWLDTRPATMAAAEEKNCITLLGFWDTILITDCTSRACDDFRTEGFIHLHSADGVADNVEKYYTSLSSGH